MIRKQRPKRIAAMKPKAVKKLAIKDVHKRIAVVVCHENGTKTADISEATGVTLRQTQRVLKHWKEDGTWEDRRRSGRPKTATTEENIDKVSPRGGERAPAQTPRPFRSKARSSATRSAP